MSALPCRHFLELLLGVVHLVDHSIRVRIEVREAALCVGRSTGVAGLFASYVALARTRGSPRATGGGRQASGMSRGRRVGVEVCRQAGARCLWLEDGAEEWSMAAEEAVNIEATSTRTGRRGRELAAWWMRRHCGTQ